MSFLDDPDRVKVFKKIILINAFATLINLGIFAYNAPRGNWLCVLNLACALFSAVQTYRCYKQLPEIKRAQEQRILDILTGKYS